MARARENDSPALPMTRREAIATVPAVLATGAALGQDAPAKARPRIAAIVTEYRKMSHGQGIVDRFLDGYGWGGQHYRPGVDIVSLYVDQKPKGDLSEERVRRHPGLKIYPTIAEALTCGGDRLAVDGVLSIGEHGRYPRNEKGQHLYPRYEFFQQIVEVFRRSGRSVPVFNDKHLSWNWAWAKEMVETARALGFPFMAGSSLPVTWRLPSVDVPHGADGLRSRLRRLRGAGQLRLPRPGNAPVHGRAAQGGRNGGRRGPARFGAARSGRRSHAGSWDAGGCDLELFEACLCRSFRLSSPRPGYGNAYPELSQMPALARDPVLYRIEYADGLKGTLLMLSGLVQDFTVALRIKGQPRPLSTQMYLPGLSPGQTLPNFFSPLSHHIETMFMTGKAPYPVERTLLTTGLLATGVESLHAVRNGSTRPTCAACDMQAPRESNFWQMAEGGAPAGS